MTSALQFEFDIDPERQVERLAEIIQEQHPPAKIRHVEKVLVADGGPVDYLGWLILEDYEDHCLFYKDDNPDQKTLSWLLSITPQRSEIAQFKRFLYQNYEVYDEDDRGVVIEIPDPYLPGTGPKANIGFYHNPLTDDINSGIITSPVELQDDILEDTAKLVPARDLETFLLNAGRELQAELQEEAERHTIKGDINALLEEDPNFRQETVRDVPLDIHPKYGGTEAELWQKPISHVDYLAGSQGFVQLWTPTSEEEIGLLSLTRGEFDRDTALDEVRSALSDKIQ